MVIFHSFLYVYQRVSHHVIPFSAHKKTRGKSPGCSVQLLGFGIGLGADFAAGIDVQMNSEGHLVGRMWLCHAVPGNGGDFLKKSPKWTGKMMIDYDRLMGFGDFMEYSIFRPADGAWDTQISRRSTRQKCWSPDKINTGWGPLQIAFSWDSGWILWYMNYPAKSDNFYGNSPKNAEHYRCPNNKLYGDLPKRWG